MKLAIFDVRSLGFGRLPRRTQNRLILGSFFTFLLFIGVENQLHMPQEIKAFRNDAYVMRLRDRIRREFLAFQAGQSGALNVRANNLDTKLGEIVDLLDLARPEALVLVNGPAGVGRLTGMGHPHLGGNPEKTVWQLAAGRPGGSLELDVLPAEEPTRSPEGDDLR